MSGFGFLVRPLRQLLQTGMRTGAIRARTLIGVGAVTSATGVGVAGTLSPDLGGVLLVAGWLVLILGTHGFGRAGAG
jgi:hypothetical protein